MEASTDAELVGLARSGNKDAFGVLVERYMPMACRVATGMVHHPDTAQELAQEAVLQAYLSIDRLREASRFQSWLYGIVLNVCCGYIRQQGADLLSLEVVSGGFRRDDPVFVGEGRRPSGRGGDHGAAQGGPRSLSEKQYSKLYASLVECKDANYSTTKSRLL